MQCAARYGHLETLQELLIRGANMHSHDGTRINFFDMHVRSCMLFQLDSGWTLLHHAASEGHLNIVKALLERGANVGAKDSTWDGHINHACYSNVSFLA